MYPERSSTFNPSRRLEYFWTSHSHSHQALRPFTSAAVLLVQRYSDSEKTILKLADRRLGYRGGRLPSKDICNTPYVKPRSVAPNWFELLCDDENRPNTKIWEDWMWEVSTSRYKLSSHNTELTVNRLLHRLQGHSRLFGVVCLRITSESTTLHLITNTNIIQGLVFEYIPGVNMAKLTPGC